MLKSLTLISPDNKEVEVPVVVAQNSSSIRNLTRDSLNRAILLGRTKDEACSDDEIDDEDFELLSEAVIPNSQYEQLAHTTDYTFANVWKIGVIYSQIRNDLHLSHVDMANAFLVLFNRHNWANNSSRFEQGRYTALLMRDCVKTYIQPFIRMICTPEGKEKVLKIVSEAKPDADIVKKRLTRGNITVDQRDYLEKFYCKNPYPFKPDLRQLSETLSLDYGFVVRWFQRRRISKKKYVPP